MLNGGIAVKADGSFRRLTVLLSVLLCAFFTAVLFQWEALSQIVSPILSVFATGILYIAYTKSDQTMRVRFTVLYCAIGCAAWGIADIAWAVISFAGGTPDDSTILQVLYVVTNCFFMIAFLVFAFQQFRKWDRVQFGIDLFVTGFISIVLFWLLFMQKDIRVLGKLLESDPTSILSIATDVVIGICILSFFLSVRNGRIPVCLHILSAGLFSFAIFDILYYYLSYNGLYFPNNISDFLYGLSIAVVAFGALWKTYRKSRTFDQSIMTNVGNRRKWLFLLIFPTVMILDVITGFVSVRLTIADLLAVGVPILFYWAAGKYVQLSLEKESLLTEMVQIQSAFNLDLQKRLNKAATADLVFRTVMDPILLIDKNGIIKMCNNATAALLKDDINTIVGQPITNFQSQNILNDNERTELFRNSFLVNVELDLIDKDGLVINAVASVSVAYDDSGEVLGYVVNIHDMTETKKNLEILDTLSNRDMLTNLPNRRMLFSCLQDSLNHYENHKQRFAVLFLDLDGFKTINDVYGHVVGDDVLIAVGEKLQIVTRKQDIVARIGGDEFVVLLNNINSEADAHEVRQRIQELFLPGLDINSKKYRISVSIGMSICPEDGAAADMLVNTADERMYIEKTGKRICKTH